MASNFPQVSAVLSVSSLKGRSRSLNFHKKKWKRNKWVSRGGNDECDWQWTRASNELWWISRWRIAVAICRRGSVAFFVGKAERIPDDVDGELWWKISGFSTEERKKKNVFFMARALCIVITSKMEENNGILDKSISSGKNARQAVKLY